jgi:hypothetical protein
VNFSEFRLLAAALFVGTCLTVFNFPSRADTVYTYTGSTFTTLAPGYTCSSLCDVSGSFTLAQPLPPNLALFSTAINPVSFDLTAGPISLTSGTDSLFVGTNAAGAIVSWSWVVIGPTGSLQARILTQNDPANAGFTFDDVRLGNKPAPFVGPIIASVFPTFAGSGNWSSTGTSSVPEPRSLELLGAGLLALIILRSKLL